MAKSSRVKLKAGKASGPRKRKGVEESRGVVLAIGAHPDDIEFMMGGTLLLLGRAGFETHYLSVASGSCGSSVHGAGELRIIRRQEAESAARILGARHHVSLVDDLEVLYETSTLRRLAAVMREVKPGILLVPSPEDYMEDHVNTARLAVTAAFARGMRNFRTQPPRAAVEKDVTVYHAMPHGLMDPLRRRIQPGAYVDVTSVGREKEAALGAHRSQHDWLAASQKMSGPLREMERFAKELGRMSGRFQRAEGWRRRLHYGFCGADADPMAVGLGRRYWVDRRYEAALRKGW